MKQKFLPAFTIVELVLYMGIFSILITLLGGIFVNLIDLQLGSQSVSESTRNLHYLFSRFQYDIYRSSSVTVPASSGQSSSNLGLIIDGQLLTYSYSYPNLTLTNPSGSFVLNSPDLLVTGFTVTRLGAAGATNLQIDLSVQSAVNALGKTSPIVNYSSSYTLR